MQKRDADQCPHCGQANQCAVAACLPAGDCWCWGQDLKPTVAAAHSATKHRQRCLCKQCGMPFDAIAETQSQKLEKS